MEHVRTPIGERMGLKKSKQSERPETNRRCARLAFFWSVLGSAGVGYLMGPGNWTRLPLTVAEPVVDNASTALALQAPTPVRGVYRFPLTVTLP